MFLNYLFCGVVFLLGSEAMKVPPFIKTCKKYDPNFKECALKSAREAIPYIVKGDRKYHMQNMDPIVVEHAAVSTDPGALGLAIEVDDIRFYGMPEAELLDFNMDFDKQELSYKLHLPRCEMLSNYNISGKILILPIKGHGKLNMTFVDLVYVLTMKYDLVKRDNGKEYMKMTDGEMKQTTKKAYIKLDNLFNGDKALGDQMNLFLNENYDDITKEFGPIVFQTVVSVIKSVLDKTIGQIPYEDVFPTK